MKPGTRIGRKLVERLAKGRDEGLDDGKERNRMKGYGRLDEILDIGSEGMWTKRQDTVPSIVVHIARNIFFVCQLEKK